MLEAAKKIIEQVQVRKEEENDSGINQNLVDFRKKIISVLKKSSYPERYPEKWEALKSCCTQVHAKTTCSCGDKRTFHANTCKNKLCPICNHNKAQKRANTNLLRLKHLQITQPELNYFFVTFTIAPGKSFRERYNTLQNGLKEIKRRAFWKDNIVGGINNVEAVIGKGSKEWHVHSHSILACNSTWINHEELKQDWESITGAKIIHIRRIKETEISSGQIKEAFKYPFKMHELEEGSDGKNCYSINEKALIEIALNSAKLKFYNTFGVLREVGREIKNYEKAIKTIEENNVRERGFDELNPPCPKCLKPVSQSFYELNHDGTTVRTSVPFDTIVNILAGMRAQNKAFLVEYINLRKEELPNFEVLIKLKSLIRRWEDSS